MQFVYGSSLKIELHSVLMIGDGLMIIFLMKSLHVIRFSAMFIANPIHIVAYMPHTNGTVTKIDNKNFIQNSLDYAFLIGLLTSCGLMCLISKINLIGLRYFRTQ